MSDPDDKDPALPETSESQTPVADPSTEEGGAEATQSDAPSATQSAAAVEEIEPPPPPPLAEPVAAIEEVEPPPSAAQSASVVEDTVPPPSVTESATVEEITPPPPPVQSAAVVEEIKSPPPPVQSAADVEDTAPPSVTQSTDVASAASPSVTDVPPSTNETTAEAAPPSAPTLSDAANIAAAAADIATAARNIAAAAAHMAGPGSAKFPVTGAASGAGSSAPLATSGSTDPEGPHLFKERVNFGDYVNWVGEKPPIIRTKPGETPMEASAGGTSGKESGETSQKEPGETPGKEPGEISGKEPGSQQPNQAPATGGAMTGEGGEWKLEKDPAGLGEFSPTSNANSVNATGGNPPQPCGPATQTAGTQPPGSTLAGGSNDLENLERNPSQIGQSLKYAQTDAEGNLFQNDKGSDCTPKPGSGACEGCTHAGDKCFPGQTECIDLEYTQLVGVAHDFADVAQDLFRETKQLGWYIVSQCLQFMDDDICDPCACRNANGDEPTDGEMSNPTGNPEDTTLPPGETTALEDENGKLAPGTETLGEDSDKPKPEGPIGEETPELLEDLPESEESKSKLEKEERKRKPLPGTTVPSSTELAEGDQLVKDPSQMAAIATAAEVASTTSVAAPSTTSVAAPSTTSVAAETPTTEESPKSPDDKPPS